jgi:hypothetical protein
MLIIVPCFKSQYFQQTIFVYGLAKIMLGVYPIEITFISFFLATYDTLTPWHICLHGGIDGGLHFLLWDVVFVNKKKEIIFARYLTIILIQVQESFLGSS